MRISYLLRREPFGEILETTCTTYWSQVLGHKVEVSWGKNNTTYSHIWRGNIYLNFFCVDDVDPDCFEIIKREFRHSPKRSRRLLQAAYVHAAVRPPTRNWLSQVQFSVSEELPLAREQLLIGGNRRIRIIHPAKGKSMVIHKHGFSKMGFDREVFARMGPASSVAPKFFGLDDNGASFSEAYFIGTPVNRLASAHACEVREHARERLIIEVHQSSMRIVQVSEYVMQLLEKLRSFSPELMDSALALTQWILKQCATMEVRLVFSHGDFQDANILVNGDVIHIIDWENATERTQLYDLATMSSGIRLASNSLDVWRAQLNQWLAHPHNFSLSGIGEYGRIAILAHVAIWWIEETIFQLDEANASTYVDIETVQSTLGASLNSALQILVSVV
jgi:hypothetical protein